MRTPVLNETGIRTEIFTEWSTARQFWSIMIGLGRKVEWLENSTDRYPHRTAITYAVTVY